MTWPFVVVEGLSGTGKTSVATELAELVEGAYVHTPTGPYRAVHADVDVHAGATERYLFYLASLARAADEIGRELACRPVICDRWIATTQSWHALLGAPVLDAVVSPNLIEPDVTVLIVCDEAERQRRLDQRGRTANDLVEAASGLENALQRRYREFADLEVDSTYDSPRQLAEELAAVILRSRAAA